MKKIAVIGCPNAGKSTLVNSLTGAALKVGNWHGVTVTREDRSYNYLSEEYVLSDLPGVYTLKSDLAEEGETLKALRKENYDGIILVADAASLKKSLTLQNECQKLKLPIVVFINLYGDFLKNKGKFDSTGYEKATGIKVFTGEANDKRCAEKFKSALKEVVSRDYCGKTITAAELDAYYTMPQVSRPLDDFFERPIICILAFLSLMMCSVYLAFGAFSPGNYLSELISAAISVLMRVFDRFLSGFCTPFVKDLVVEGLIGGVGAAAEFLPQVAIMSACLTAMEQSGLIARLAVAIDGLLEKAGLGGKAVYALLCGYGCGAVAASVCGGIEDKSVRRRAVLSLPFTSCSAKTPVYAFVAKYCFGEYAFLIIAVIYVLSIVFPVLNSAFLYKTLIKDTPKPLIFELANVRTVKFRILIGSALSSAKNFIVRLGTTIVLASVALFILSRVTIDFSYVETVSEKSFVSYIGKAISPLFAPMGIKDWRYAVAAVTGIFAKEGVVSALAALFPSGLGLGFAEGLSFTAFCYAYTPCVAAMSATAKTAGKRYAAFSAAWQFIIALLFAYFIYFVCKMLGLVL